MTVIAIAVDALDKSIVIGSDSARTHDAGIVANVVGGKVWRTPTMVVGAAGPTEYCQALQHRVRWPAAGTELDEGFMVTTMADRLLEAIEAAKISNDRRNGCALIGLLWEGEPQIYLASSHHIARCGESYFSVGCGCELALGAMNCYFRASKPVAINAVREGLAAACRWNDDCAAPFHILILAP